MVPPVRPILDRAPSTCAWCAAPLDGTPPGAPGARFALPAGSPRRTRGPPTPSSTRPTAAGTAPSVGRFSGPGRRAAPPLPRPARPRDSTGSRRPAGCSTSARATERCWTPSRAVAGTALGLEREADRRRRPRRRARRARRRVGRRSSSGTRSSTCAAPGAALDRAARLLAPRRRARGRRAERGSLQARAFGDRWLALDLPRHLVHVPGGAAAGPPSRARPARRARQPPARRPGASSAGCTGWSARCPGTARPLRRDPPPRRPASRRCRRRAARATLAAGARSPSRWPRPAPRSRSSPGAAAASTWRRAVAERPPGQGDRGDARPQRGAHARADGRGDPARLGRRDHPRRRQVDRRDRRAGPRRLPLHVIWHPHNVGYGGNQKTCYLEALQREADVGGDAAPRRPVRAEPDPAPRRRRSCAARPTSCWARGWPSRARPARAACRCYKYVANRGLTAIENRILGTHLSEMHTGYRAYSRRAAARGAVPAQLRSTSASTRSC